MRKILLLLSICLCLLFTSCGTKTEISEAEAKLAELQAQSTGKMTTAVDVELLTKWMIEDDAYSFLETAQSAAKDNLNSWLKIAIDYDAPQIASMLQENGAEIPENVDGKSLYEYSLNTGSGVGVTLAVQDLKQAKPGREQLVNAINQRSISCVIALINCGVNPKATDAELYNALHELFLNKGYADAYYNYDLAQEQYALGQYTDYRRTVLNPEKYDELIALLVKKKVDFSALNLYEEEAVELKKIGTEDEPWIGSMWKYALINNGVIEMKAEDVLKEAFLTADTNLLKYALKNGADINSEAADKAILDGVSLYSMNAYAGYFLKDLKDAGRDFSREISSDYKTMLNAVVDLEFSDTFMLHYYQLTAAAKSLLSQLVSYTPKDLIDAPYKNEETAFARILNREANTEIACLYTSGTYFSAVNTRESCDETMDLLKILTDAGAAPNPKIGKFYEMQILRGEEGKIVATDVTGTPIVQQVKLTYALH